MILDDELLNAVAAEAKRSERLRMNRDLRNSADDTSQRMLNALEVGTVLPIHRHRSTSETQILLRGRIDVMFSASIPAAGLTGWISRPDSGIALRYWSPPLFSRRRTDRIVRWLRTTCWNKPGRRRTRGRRAMLCAPEAFFCGGVSGSSSCGCWPSRGRWRGCGSWRPPCPHGGDSG